jgi:hypothetical protein
LRAILNVQGWSGEAQGLDSKEIFTFSDVPITLQQASTFSSQKQSGIVVGDATACASFFQGIGANTAEIAGQFFKEIRKDKNAFLHFNQAMKQATDTLIEGSAFLFSQEENLGLNDLAP